MGVCRTAASAVVGQAYEYLIHVHPAMARQATQKTSCTHGKPVKVRP
ncbi:MAG: hypothetical protein ACYS9X_32455 [Planctomycetota bacterium]